MVMQSAMFLFQVTIYHAHIMFVYCSASKGLTQASSSFGGFCEGNDAAARTVQAVYKADVGSTGLVCLQVGPCLVQ